MSLALVCTILALACQRPSAPDTQHPLILVGWRDELDDIRTWGPLAMENRARSAEDPPGHFHLWLNHVPDGWPYTYQWSGVTKDARVDVARFPFLMARVGPVTGYAHMDVDVLDASGKAVKTLRTSTLNGPGLSTLDLRSGLDPAVYSLRLRLIVGGENTGCSADFDWVRFVGEKDARFLSEHPDYNRLKLVAAPNEPKLPPDGFGYVITPICPSATKANLNAHGLVAGVATDSDGKPYAFVWRSGRFLWRAPGYHAAAGPNARDEVALADDKGLLVWRGGKVNRCLDPQVMGLFNGQPVPEEIIGIDDKGKILGMVYGLESSYATVTWPKPDPKPLFTFGSPDSPAFRVTAMGPDGSTAGIMGRVAGVPNHHYTSANSYYRKGKTTSPIGGQEEYDHPKAVSSTGEVVGQTQAYRPHPFWWRGGSVQALQLPNDDSTGTAVAINSHSHIVGTMTWATYDSRTSEHMGYRQAAALWLGGRVVDLDDWLVPNQDWVLSEGLAINDRDEILAIGFSKSKPGTDELLLLRPRRLSNRRD